MVNFPPETFWSRVERGDGCWTWTGAVDTSGYGRFKTAEGRYVGAHRLAWTLTRGPIPGALFVCHHCDTPRCVRPEHLFLGTHRDNMRDMAIKKRGRTCDKRLGNHHMATLSMAEVQDLLKRRAEGASQRTLAREFGVCASTVRNVLAGRHWVFRAMKGSA